jgi:hypothetical protein
MTNTEMNHAADPEDVDAVEGDDVLGSASGGAGGNGGDGGVGGDGGNGGVGGNAG